MCCVSLPATPSHITHHRFFPVRIWLRSETHTHERTRTRCAVEVILWHHARHTRYYISAEDVNRYNTLYVQYVLLYVDREKTCCAIYDTFRKFKGEYSSSCVCIIRVWWIRFDLDRAQKRSTHKSITVRCTANKSDELNRYPWTRIVHFKYSACILQALQVIVFECSPFMYVLRMTGMTIIDDQTGRITLYANVENDNYCKLYFRCD